MAVRQATYEEIERMKKNIGGRISNGAVTDGQKEANKCPLSLVCFRSCSWWKNGRCVFPEGGKSAVLKTQRNHKWALALQENMDSIDIGGHGKKASNRFIEYFGYTLLTATSGALLWFFGCIWIEGSHYIQEPNIMILGVETAAVAAILGFAIHSLIRVMKRKTK